MVPAGEPRFRREQPAGRHAAVYRPGSCDPLLRVHSTRFGGRSGPVRDDSRKDLAVSAHTIRSTMRTKKRRDHADVSNEPDLKRESARERPSSVKEASVDQAIPEPDSRAAHTGPQPIDVPPGQS